MVKNKTTKTTTPQWEVAQKHSETQYVTMQRLAVPGGWLYDKAPGDYRSTPVFVADATAPHVIGGAS